MNIFVFGSNLAGRHGAGAALVARRSYGAVQGVGEGPRGHTYAIPTKDEQIRTRTLEEIKRSVDTFIMYAGLKPESTFLVTCIGCGLAGYEHHQIAPMFEKAPYNCLFSTKWSVWLPHHKTWTHQ